MGKVIVLYSTTDGHTIKICQRIQSVLKIAGNEAAVLEIDSAGSDQLAVYDKIIIGASIRYGKHNKNVFDFVAKNEGILKRKSSAFFTVNVVARKSNKNTPETNPYLKKFLSQVSWKPDKLAVFAGKIDYQKYGVFDRVLIRLIMFLTKGPTDPNAVVDFTDWEQVEEFGKIVGEM